MIIARMHVPWFPNRGRDRWRCTPAETMARIKNTSETSCRSMANRLMWYQFIQLTPIHDSISQFLRYLCNGHGMGSSLSDRRRLKGKSSSGITADSVIEYWKFFPRKSRFANFRSFPLTTIGISNLRTQCAISLLTMVIICRLYSIKYKFNFIKNFFFCLLKRRRCKNHQVVPL